MDDKQKNVGDLSSTLAKLNAELKTERAGRKLAEARGVSLDATVAALSGTVERLEAEAEARGAELAEALALVARLDAANKHLVRKTLEMGGGASQKTPQTALEAAEAAAAAGVMSAMKGKDLLAIYDATGLVLRRSAMAASLLADYEAGTALQEQEVNWFAPSL